VLGVALAYDQPLEANWMDAFTLDGAQPGSRGDARTQAQLRIVSPGYFETLGVEVIAGRSFDDRPRADGTGTALVNEAFERAFGGRAIGRRLRSAASRMTWGPDVPADFEVVGVVEDERFRGLERPAEPAVYLSTRDFPLTAFVVIVRTAPDDARARAAAGEMRAGIRAVESRATVAAPRTLAEILAEHLTARRVTADVIGGFAAAALSLAALGLYGLLAVIVSSRTREIGIRLALGAPPLAVARGVLGDGVVSTAGGLAAGLILSLAAGRLIEGLLVGVSGRDPATLAVVSATVMAAAICAAALPAVRAARVDPAIVLKAE
jgi:putative ABC transport system permease protein